ncbi:site-specific integrase [Vibrio vulnificus]|uniref:site-specific integrase n=1 Tax=Vibrio vulnificus TaxID=672 RepID=UPI0005FB97DB|nr:site-specific integrase [Vibrio vulnificus]
MNKRFKFTNANLKSLPANASNNKTTELEFSDTECIGLKLLSGRSGSKRFLLRYTLEGRKRSIAIGRFPDIDVNVARKIARQHKAKIAEGVDPKEERDGYKRTPTVKEFFWDTFLPLAKKKKTWKDDVARFNRHCQSIANIRYDELRATDVQQIQITMSNSVGRCGTYKPATCNRVLALLKTLGGLAERLLDIPNVASRVSLLKENNIRQRFCSIEETKAIIREARKHPNKSAGGLIAMLFLTGCRVSEMRFRRHTDIDWETRTLTIPDTKNGTTHIVYLTDLMIEILKDVPRKAGNPYLFPGRLKGKPIGTSKCAFEVIKQKAGIAKPEEVVLHTARHSVASLLLSHADKTGADTRSVQMMLNHKSLSSTMRYAKLSIERQRNTCESFSNLISGD